MGNTNAILDFEEAPLTKETKIIIRRELARMVRKRAIPDPDTYCTTGMRFASAQPFQYQKLWIERFKQQESFMLMFNLGVIY